MPSLNLRQGPELRPNPKNSTVWDHVSPFRGGCHLRRCMLGGPAPGSHPRQCCCLMVCRCFILCRWSSPASPVVRMERRVPRGGGGWRGGCHGEAGGPGQSRSSPGAPMLFLGMCSSSGGGGRLLLGLWGVGAWQHWLLSRDGSGEHPFGSLFHPPPARHPRAR